MPSTAANPSPFDPLARMPEDEARFVLRERDFASPGAITEYARIRRLQAFRRYGESTREEDQRAYEAELRQCKDAEEIALEWGERQRGHDVIDGEKSLYQDVQHTEEQIAQLDLAKKRAAAVQHLREAAYHIECAREGLAEAGIFSEFLFSTLRDSTNAAANAIKQGGMQ